jgi:hypothetical protein
VSGGTVLRLRDLIDQIVASKGLRRRRLHVPLALCRVGVSALAVVLPPSFFSPDALLGLTQDAELDHSQFGRECGYAPLSLEEGFARTFGKADGLGHLHRHPAGRRLRRPLVEALSVAVWTPPTS